MNFIWQSVVIIWNLFKLLLYRVDMLDFISTWSSTIFKIRLDWGEILIGFYWYSIEFQFSVKWIIAWGISLGYQLDLDRIVIRFWYYFDQLSTGNQKFDSIEFLLIFNFQLNVYWTSISFQHCQKHCRKNLPYPLEGTFTQWRSTTSTTRRRWRSMGIS